MKLGSLSVEACSGDITAEGFDFAPGESLEARQAKVLELAIANDLVPVAAMPLYRSGQRRIIIVDPSYPHGSTTPG